jgi:hypothetical protein
MPHHQFVKLSRTVTTQWLVPQTRSRRIVVPDFDSIEGWGRVPKGLLVQLLSLSVDCNVGLAHQRHPVFYGPGEMSRSGSRHNARQARRSRPSRIVLELPKLLLGGHSEPTRRSPTARDEFALTHRWRRQSRANPSLKKKGINREFCSTAPRRGIRGKIGRRFQAVGEKFPTAQNREFIQPEQGIKSSHQGIEQPHQGIPVGVGMPPPPWELDQGARPRQIAQDRSTYYRFLAHRAICGSGTSGR